MTRRIPTRPYVKVEIRKAASATWVDVTDYLMGLRFSRGNVSESVTDALTLGDLSLTLKGNLFSASANPDLIRPSSVIRVQGQDAGGTWRKLYHGELAIPSTTYERDDDTGKMVPMTVVTATDVFGFGGSVSNVYSSYVDGNIMTRLAKVLPTWFGAAVTYTQVGATDTSTGPVFADFLIPGGFSTNCNFLWTVIRDSRNGTLWAGRDSERQIMVRTNGAPPPVTTPVITFTDTYADSGSTIHHYTQLDLSHDGESFTTALGIELLLTAGSSPPAPGTYSYLDYDATVDYWPRREASVTWTDRPLWPGLGLDVNASYLLGTRPLPATTPKTVRIDAMRNRAAFTSDLLYQPARVKSNTPIPKASAASALYNVVATTEPHGMVVGDGVRFTATSMPAPLVAGVVYYVLSVYDERTFYLSATPGGSTIDITSNGSGLVTYPLAHLEYDAAHHIIREEHIVTRDSWHIDYSLKTFPASRIPTVIPE